MNYNYEENLILRKNNRYISLEKPNGDIGIYDLKTKEYTTKKWNKNEKITERKVKNLKTFLRGYRLYNIHYENVDGDKERKLRRFLNFIENNETRISNIGTILEKFDKYSVVEEIINHPELKLDGMYYNRDVCVVPKKSIKEYNKNFIKGLIENDISINTDIENFYKYNLENNEKAQQIFFSLLKFFKKYVKININDRKPYYSHYNDDNKAFMYIKDNIKFDLLCEININPNSYCNYLKYLVEEEKLHIKEAIKESQDYYNMYYMMNSNGRKYRNKYPKNLLSTIAITSKNYNTFKIKYDEEMFKKRVSINNYKNLEDSIKIHGLDKSVDVEYKIIAPKTTDDVKTEGINMNNCVGGYIRNIINGSTKILFLRRADNIDNSLVTIEVYNNTIHQAYGACNSKPTKSCLKVLKQYKINKNLINGTCFNF